MLTIRAAQFAAFRAVADDELVERLRVYLPTIYPRHCAALGEEGTRERIRTGLALADAHGIERGRAVVVLVELLVEFGARLERSPDRAWAERMLARRDVPGAVRVAAVRDHLAKSTGGRLLVVQEL
ncbi:MAG: hypothetical protein U0414_23400 [Polyangiaceae bacterium]